MLHGEHSAILSTFIKLSFVIKSLFLSDRFTQVYCTDLSDIFARVLFFLFYFFVKIEPSQNSSLSFIGVRKSCPSREFLTSLFAKTIFSLNFC